MKVSLKSAAVSASIIMASLPILCSSAIFQAMFSQTKNAAATQFERAEIMDAVAATADIYRVCEVMWSADRRRCDSIKKTLFAELEKFGSPSLTEPTFEREIRNQADMDSRRKTKVPLLKFGGTLVDCANAEDKDDPVNALLETLKIRLGCDFTLFAKMNDDGDFLRVASTHTDTVGENISGSFITKASDNFQRGTIAETLASRAEYFGISNTASGTITVDYVPIFDANGRVVGAAHFGTQKSAVDEVSKYIQAVNASKTVRAWVIDESSPDNPILKISDAQTEGNVSIKDEISTIRKNATYEIIEKSRALKSGHVGTEFFSPANSRKKTLLTYTYFPQWKWVIGVMSELPEKYAAAETVAQNISTANLEPVKTALMLSLAATLMALLFARTPSKKLAALLAATQSLSDETPSAAREKFDAFGAGGNEGFSELNYAAGALQAAAKQLELAQVDIRNDAENILRASRTSQKTVEKIGGANADSLAQMKAVSRAGKNILSSSKALDKTTANSSDEIKKALNLNRECENAIDLLMRKYETLASSSNNVSKKLRVINENAEKITSLVATIADVSLRTNMLSLNASVEAEKIGETGLGFAVVSRQIRTFADKTSKASRDIRSIVLQMQSSVNAGVMEMDRFSANMRLNSETIVETAKKLSLTISNIESIDPQFGNISQMIGELSSVAVKITQTIETLTRESEAIGKTLIRINALNASAEPAAAVLSLTGASAEPAKRGGNRV